MDLYNLNLEDVINIADSYVSVPKQYVRDVENPFELYNEVQFKRRFRISEDCVLHGILPKIQEGLTKMNNRGLPLAPLVSGDLTLLVFIAVHHIKNSIQRVSILLASHIRSVIKMPRNEENQTENGRLFEKLVRGNEGIGLPGIDSAIDCAHIRLVYTRFQEIREIFRNRQVYFSLNVQVVVGPRMEFLDIVPE